MHYRRRGKIDKKSIDNMFVRLGLYLSDNKDVLYKSRDRAMRELKALTRVKAAMSQEYIRKEILALAKDLPKTGRVTYGSKEMEAFRPRVDKIVSMLLMNDSKAMKANAKFYKALALREREVKNVCGCPFLYSNKNVKPSDMESDLPKYNNKIDEKNIHVIEDIKADYKRRQGNLVLGLAKFIKPEYYESKRKRKANDTALKRSLGISRRKINSACKKFFNSFGQESELLERDFFHRLQEIEKEIEEERKKKDNGGDYKN